MKICSINQPYFLPYFGYFSLIAKSHKFILLDDVSMIKKGFIHRNTIVQDDKIYKFTIPIAEISQNKKINDTYTHNFPSFFSSFRQRIEYCYSKYPYYYQVDQLLNSVDSKIDYKISELAELSIKLVLETLKLDTQLFKSSDFQLIDVVGQQRIIKLCKLAKSSKYINLPGGRSIYDPELFKENNIRLSFLDLGHEKFKKFLSREKQAPLSIVDTLARFSADDVRRTLI